MRAGNAVTLVEFLRARLAQDEQTAREAGEARIAWLTYRDCQGGMRYTTVAAEAADDVWIAAGEELPAPTSVRIVYDPAQAIREVAHKRAVLERHDWWINRPTETDAELHARCAHPDYEYETTTGGRKTWDEADEPPDGPDGKPDHSWERNVEEGRDGWERFDYTEESYWRRRLPPEKAAENRSRRERPPRELLELAAIYADQPGYRPEWRP